MLLPCRTGEWIMFTFALSYWRLILTRAGSYFTLLTRYKDVWARLSQDKSSWMFHNVICLRAGISLGIFMCLPRFFYALVGWKMSFNRSLTSSLCIMITSLSHYHHHFTDSNLAGKVYCHILCFGTLSALKQTGGAYMTARLFCFTPAWAEKQF